MKIVALLALLLSADLTFAQGQLPVGQFDIDTVTTIEPRLFPGVPETYDRSSDAKDVILGVRIDLNGDGKTDLIQKIWQNCGTGGCSFLIYDGASFKQVGDLFGTRFFISKTKINGWPVVEGYHHTSSRSGMFVSYVYDGSQYIVASAVYLQGESAGELFKRYEVVPKLAP